MPTYGFRNKETGEEIEKIMKISELDTFRAENPQLETVIQSVAVGDSHKLAIINRFHRTLKEKMLKFFIATNSVRWIDDLQKMISNYNNTYNSGIKYSPLEASKPLITAKIIQEKREKTDEINANEKIYNIGDKCRIFKDKELFDKLQTSYSEKIYNIIKVNKNTVDVENDEVVYKNI